MPESQSTPPWADSQASRAWLENRYSLGDASLGSPLYRYMQETWESESYNMEAGMSFVGMGEMLSWEELVRWQREHPQLTIPYSWTREKLYPDFGEPTNIPRPDIPASLQPGRRTAYEAESREPKWTDVEASKNWLEQSYPMGSSALESPLLRYTRACHASKDSNSSPVAYLGSMLTEFEWKRFLSHCPDSIRYRQHGHPNNILYPEYDGESPDAMDVDSDDRGRPTTSLATSSRKRSIEEAEYEQHARFPTKRMRASSGSSGEDSVRSNNPKETPLVEPSRKRSIGDVADVPPITSMHKRQRLSPKTDSGLPPSSPFDPPEQSTPSLLPRQDQTPTEASTTDEMPDPTRLGHQFPSYEDPTTVIFKPNDARNLIVGSGPQSGVIGDGRNLEATNTESRSTVHTRAAFNVDNQSQEHDNNIHTPIKPEPQDKHRVHVEDDQEDTTVDSEHSRDRTTSPIIQGSNDRGEQTAVSVVLPVPQHSLVANQELLRDQDTTNIPVMQNKRHRGRKPGIKGANISQSGSQRRQGKRKPSTRIRKNRVSKPQREQQAYVGRLRSGVGDRKHKKPSK